VIVPIGYVPRRCRYAIVLVAACLIVLQAFLAGIATARAGAALASDPVDVICHGSGSTDSGDRTAPDQIWHLCCTYCLSAAPAFTPPDVPSVVLRDSGQAARPITYQPVIVVIAPGAVRAGSSQAPPGQV
jgi:hypothetical protein